MSWHFMGIKICMEAEFLNDKGKDKKKKGIKKKIWLT